jgi:PPOX class probable F420-dependent enzyme
MPVSEEKYILLTTFRRDGRAVATPVWLVDLGGDEIGFWTSSASGKAKRLAHTSRVTVQPSNVRGVVKPGTEATEARARLVTGAELDAVRTKVFAKYGFQAKIAKPMALLTARLRGKSFPYADCAVVITLPAGV